MEIAVTGGNGRLGRVIVRQLVEHGHRVCILDRVDRPDLNPADDPVRVIQIDLVELQPLTEALRGCDAVIHLAGFPGPQGQPPGVVYSNNTIASYNVLYSASSLGIRHVSLASSINALGGIESRVGHFDYFPVDERHPTYNEDDYSLGKWVMEQQADSFARRFPQMTISSLRIHGLPDEPAELQNSFDTAAAPSARGLWGFTLIREAARAFELAVQADFRSHEVFFITAQRTYSAIPSLDLARYAYPGVPVRGDLSGHKSFYDCSKAARLLGWVHEVV